MDKRAVRITTVVIVFLLLLASSLGRQRGLAQSRGSALGTTGTIWGGEHVVLEVTPEGAMLEFDCATGTITKAVQLDAAGKFKVTGSFTRERPGPVVRDGNPAAVATYSGSIQGGTMKLTITSGTQDESQGEYVLVRGKRGHVMKCR